MSTKKPSLAIALNVQRRNKPKKMAEGGKIRRYDEGEVDIEPTKKPVKDPIPGLGPDKPGSQAWKNHTAAERGANTVVDRKYAEGGRVYDREPGMPRAKPDNTKIPEDEFLSDRWSEGNPPPRKPDDMRPPREEYMAGHFAEGGEVCQHCSGTGHYAMPEHEQNNETNMPTDEDLDESTHTSMAEAIMAKRRFSMLAEGGEVNDEQEEDPFDTGQGISHFQEEGPGERRKFNVLAREYNAGDDRQISKQPMSSKGDSREDDEHDKYDTVSAIRKKMKSGRK